MKRMTAAVLGLGLLTGLSGAAFAADAEVPADTYAAMGWYLRADAGWSWLRWGGSTDDSAGAIGGGVGYRMNDNLRADLRLDWSGNYNIGRGRDMDVTTVLGNIYYDIPLDSVITPYVGAGAGYGWGSVTNGDDRDGFAMALMAGAEVSLTDNLSADFEYRYRRVLASSHADPEEHQLLAGLRFKF
jgi:opacity protein-like surface antigen